MRLLSSTGAASGRQEAWVCRAGGGLHGLAPALGRSPSLGATTVSTMATTSSSTVSCSDIFKCSDTGSPGTLRTTVNLRITSRLPQLPPRC